MHSSRMRTGRMLTVFRSLLFRGGGCLVPGGVWPQGVCLVPGEVYLPGPGGCTCLVRGGGTCLVPGGCLVRYSPPREQNDTHV